jgi:hypothetical protein
MEFPACSGFDKSFEFHLAVDDLDHVLDIAAIFLLLQIFRLFQNKFVEARARELFRLFTGLVFSLYKCFVKLVDLFGFALRLRTRYPESAVRGLRRSFHRLLSRFARAFRLNCFRGGTEVPLDCSLFLLLRLFAKNVLVLGVGLREVVQAKSLAVLQLAAAVAISLDQRFDAPLDLRRRALSASAEVLVVFNLELTDVPFELAQLFVDRRHERKNPLRYHARRTGRTRQPARRAALRIVYPAPGTARGSAGTWRCAESFIAGSRGLW